MNWLGFIEPSSSSESVPGSVFLLHPSWGRKGEGGEEEGSKSNPETRVRTDRVLSPVLFPLFFSQLDEERSLKDEWRIFLLI